MYRTQPGRTGVARNAAAPAVFTVATVRRSHPRQPSIPLGAGTMTSRRDFLSTAARTAPAAWLASGGTGELREIGEELARFGGGPEEIARDERFWTPVQQAFTVDRSIINLNNAGV